MTPTGDFFFSQFRYDSTLVTMHYSRFYAEKHSIWQPPRCIFISIVSSHLVQYIHAR